MKKVLNVGGNNKAIALPPQLFIGWFREPGLFPLILP
jgi:hypothetical protein